MGFKPFKTAMALATTLAMAGVASAGPMTPIPSDPVATASGKVAGTRLASGVKAYLGVPYAKPPTQDLRWRPPQPLSWDGVWNADRKGAECIQVLRPHDINHYFGEEATGEDCLNLNLWTPADAKAGDKLPVVVFIYGGGGTARPAWPITTARTSPGAARSMSTSTTASGSWASWPIPN